MNVSTGQVNIKPSNWKYKLSPGFVEEEVFYSLLVLGNFYVVYAAAKVNFDAHDNSADDEERFIHSCYCSFNQKFFLRFWFYLNCALWFVAHTYGFLSITYIERFKKFGDIVKVFLACLIVCPLYCFKSFCTCKWFKQESYDGNSSDRERLLDENHDVNNFDHKMTLYLTKNVRRLWFQYCKLYVVGYTEYDDTTESIKTIITRSTDGARRQQNSGTINRTNENQEYGRDGHSNERFSNTCLCSLKKVTRASLFFVKYISQLSSVPLLLLQIFDTYSFLCFSPDSYCSNATEYEINLLQVCITLFFYCSLVMSHLASTILTWHPWPKPKCENVTLIANPRLVLNEDQRTEEF